MKVNHATHPKFVVKYGFSLIEGKGKVKFDLNLDYFLLNNRLDHFCMKFGNF